MESNKPARSSIASSWFEKNIVYAGHGKAWFEGYSVPAEGYATADCDERGKIIVRIHIDEMSARKIGLFLECTRIEICCLSGAFIADRGIVIISNPLDTTTNQRLYSFDPLYSRFEVSNSRIAEYWVLPLLNFDAHDMLSDNGLIGYPLRLIDDDDGGMTYASKRKDKYISFEFGNQAAYIQLLPDHADSSICQECSRTVTKLSAVATGCVNNNNTDFESVRQWFPIQILRLLSVAVGGGVGAPWIEFRDASGILVNRLHVCLDSDCATSEPGHWQPAFRLNQGKCIEDLLNGAVDTPHLKDRWLSVALRGLAIVGGYSVFEDRFNSIFTALDAMFKHFEVDKRNLGEALNLADKTTVNEVLKSAAKSITTLAGQAAERGDTNSAIVLEKIAARTPSATGMTKTFNDGLKALMSKHGVHDADVLNKYFNEKPFGSTTDWTGLVAYYRNVITHEGHLDMSGEHNLDIVRHVVTHLHDVLLRITLKLLGYNGNYQPTIIPYPTEYAVDWVDADTKPEQLGFTADLFGSVPKG